MKIACVGAGPAGLYFSILIMLHDPGCDITLYERRETSSTAGWGVTFGRTLLTQLYEQDRESADRIRQAACLRRGQVIHIRGARIPTPFENSYNISRRHLIDILSDRAQKLGVHIEYGREIRSRAELSEADLIVAADGVGSQIREEAGDFRTQDTWGRNKYIWLGADMVFEEFSFFFVPTVSGWIWAYAYGIDAESSTFIVECSQETWAGLGFNMLSTDEAMPVLGELFKDHLAGHRLLGDLGDGTKARWLNFRTISNQHWYSGNVVLVGDSAHTPHFTIGMGTTLALEDAIILTDSLRQHSNLETVLQSYEARRQGELLPILTEGRYSARWFENIARYIDVRPERFGTLLFARRSPLIALLPPSLYYLLRALRISIVNVIYARTLAAANSIHRRRKLARRTVEPEDRSQVPRPPKMPVQLR